MPILATVGGSQVVSSSSGGKVTAINNLTTAPVQVIGPNPERRRITFVNPHASITVYIAPTVVANGDALTPALGALGGCFPVLPAGLLMIEGECQVPWQAFSASGTGIPLTVMESNI